MAASANPPSAPMSSEGPRQRPVLAIVCRLLAGLALTTVLMLVKLGAERGIDLPQMLFVRQAMMVPILLGWLAWHKELHLMRTDRIRSHAARAITGQIGMVLNFVAPILLPLAVATTFSFSSPIFAVVLSAVLLREHVGVWRWLATTIGFVGVVLLADPFNASVPALGAIVAIGAAFMVALISVQIRDLAQSEHPIAIVTYFAIFASPVFFAVSLFFDWNLGATDWLLVVAMGITGTMAQLLLTISLRLGSVATVIGMDYVALLWATGYGWFVFDSLPPASLWIGAPFIIFAGSIIVWREHVLSRQRNEVPLR